MHRVPTEPVASQLGDSVPKLPGWQQLTCHEQQQLISLMQNPTAFSQLLALQQALGAPSPNTEAPIPSLQSFAPTSQATQPSSLGQHAMRTSQLGQASQPLYDVGLLAAALGVASLYRPLPSPPQFDRSLLHAPLPYWAAAPAGNQAANLLAAQVNAGQRSCSGCDMPSAPLVDFNSDLFRSSSLGARYASTPLSAELSAELSLRASSMPGAYHDIAARLHLNRAGITTATTSMIPVMTQEWLVIPFGTAQQLLPVYAGDVVAEPDGDAVMLIDETGQNWPMKCKYNRYALLLRHSVSHSCGPSLARCTCPFIPHLYAPWAEQHDCCYAPSPSPPFPPPTQSTS